MRFRLMTSFYKRRLILTKSTRQRTESITLEIKIMNKTKTQKPKKTAAEIGKKGGRAVVRKYGKGHMSKLGKLSAKKRWPKRK